MAIEPDEKTDRPIRTRGWTHWHHLFAPRQLLLCALFAEAVRRERPEARLILPKVVNVLSRLCRMNPNGAGGEALEIEDTFSNQALNTLYNFGCRGLIHAVNVAELPPSIQGGLQTAVTVDVLPATDIRESADLWIYDPPYADAVHYHEITEYFIAWLRKDPPAPFNRWRWDSRRPLAIQGKGEKFRANMVDALQAMVTRMPANGLQGLWCSMRLTRHVAPRTGTAFGSRISYSTS